MNTCWQHIKQNHSVPISKIISKFVNKMFSKLQNDHKNTCIQYICTWRIFLKWCCKSIMKRSAKCMCMKKYIYNDYISTMLYAFDSDTYNSNTCICISWYVLYIYVDESMNFKRCQRVELLCAVILCYKNQLNVLYVRKQNVCWVVWC